MVTWGYLLAKMVITITTKLSIQKINSVFDEKKKAARAFMRLHYAIGELSSLTSRIHQEVGRADRDDGRVRGAWLHEIDQEISDISNDFFRISDKLQHVLEIYDPTLSQCVSHLYYSKFSLLVTASRCFNVKHHSYGDSEEIRFTFPDNKLLTLDFLEHYEWLKQNKSVDIFNLDWPHSVLMGIDYENFIDKDVLPERSDPQFEDKLIMFRTLLEMHKEQLDKANASLAEFIKKNFPLIDLLYN